MAPVARIAAVLYGVSQEEIDAYGRKHANEEYKWRPCLTSCELVLKRGNHRIPVTGSYLRNECHKLFSYKPALS